MYITMILRPVWHILDLYLYYVDAAWDLKSTTAVRPHTVTARASPSLSDEAGWDSSKAMLYTDGNKAFERWRTPSSGSHAESPQPHAAAKPKAKPKAKAIEDSIDDLDLDAGCKQMQN